jgi:ABC-type antimicrobial peptide transport system permease subunit
MFGVIISLAIVSGVLFYLDSTSGTLVVNALSDVEIDTSISDITASEFTMREIQDYILNELSSPLVVSAEVIAGTNPLDFGGTGAILATGSGFNLSAISLRQGDFNFSQTYVFAVDPSYLDVFPLFNTAENISAIFEAGNILVSSNFIDDNSIQINDIVNLSFVLPQFNFEEKSINIEIIDSVNLTVGGSVNFETSIMEESLYAFEPEGSDEDTFRLPSFAQVSNCIVMSYSQFMTGFSIDVRSFQTVQVKLDHALLSLDTNIASNQLSQITNRIEVFYPQTIITDLLELSLNSVADQLNQMRLFLIYFALPGLILGTYISKYAIDITIEERKREIGVLKTKGALREQIALAIGVESSVIAILGLILGIITGYLASLSISNWLNGGGLIRITFESISLSVVIGIAIVIIAAVLSTRNILAPSITESMKNGGSKSDPLWKRIYIDFILLSLVIIVAIMNIFEFNPIPGFASAIYDFLAPLLTWIGFVLLMARLLEKILISLHSPIDKINSLLFKDIAPIITKNILFKPQRISRITIVLALTLSFGLVISAINEGYAQGAERDALYQVGSDIRIQFPSSDYLDYETSDFISQIETDLSSQIAETSAVYISNIRLGVGQLVVVGIEPETYFDVAMFEKDFLQSNTIESLQTALLDTNSGLYNNIIISSSLANPSQTTQGGRLGGFMPGGGAPQGFEQAIFTIGDELEIGLGRLNEQSNETVPVYIAEISNHLPAMADFTGFAEDEVRYAVSNADLLLDPLSDSNNTILDDGNATMLFIDVHEEAIIDEVAQNIEDWYTEIFPNSASLSIKTVNDFLENYEPLVTSLTGLTSMEFILVLAVSSLGLEIFLTSSLYERKKEFGTYYAIGGPINDVRKLILGELFLITGFSAITGILLSGIVAFMYIGFLSDLLILEVYSITIPLLSIVVLVGLLISSMGITMLLSGNRLAKLDPANILRTV